LEAIELFRQQVHEIIQQRELLGRALQEFSSLRVYPSDANFFLVKSAEGGALFQHLLSDGLLVRDVGGYPGLAGCLRISVGTAEHNQKLLESLRRWEQRT
jgi:histidinol-phosphate aminotransferase